MLHDHLVKNRASLEYRKRIFGQVAILEFFQKGDPMNSVKIKKLLFGLLLDKLRLEIMVDDHLVKNRVFQHYRKSLFGEVAILELFQRGNPKNFVQN